MTSVELTVRAERCAALGDPGRLAIVDELVGSDRSPVELRRLLGMESNLLAHHLDVLERVGLIERSRSSGDGRRRYVHLRPGVLSGLVPRRRLGPQRALFVCTRNSARSQLAAAVWTSLTGADAESAGTHPAERVDAGAVAAARRAGLRLHGSSPRAIADVGELPGLVVTVCDQAHEELDPPATRLRWSVPDPVGFPMRRSTHRSPSGSEPADRINPAAVDAMAQVGIDITAEFPKPWTDEIVRASHVVVTMGCGDAYALFPGKRYVDWELDDPAGREVADVIPIRDEIRRRVEVLLESLSIGAGRS